MQANGHRLSAVARRRFLRDGVSPGSAGLTPTAPSSALPTDVRLSADAFQEQPNYGETNAPDENGAEVVNQFSTLVEASAVTFSPSREVEELARGTIKIRLSRGQKCVLLGICSLWVKQGSVSIYGAVLGASKAIYRIYAPTSHALPAIEATTANAELEIESLNDGIAELPYIGVRSMWAPADVKQDHSLFYVLGHSFEHDLKNPGRLRELDITPWKTLLTNASAYDAFSPPRILICGKRSSGLSTLAKCIVNRLLARQSANLDPVNGTGVRVVDLDTSTPEFVPPGIISLVQVNEPVFGPPFTHFLPPSSSNAGYVMRGHFLGDIGATDLSDWHLDRVHDLLKLEKDCLSEQQKLPLIIILPKWLNGIDNETAIKLWKKMSPTQVLCLDPNPTSPHLAPWQSVAKGGDCNITQLPVHLFEKIPAVQQHDLQMQSYFHLNASAAGRPIWDETPILAGMRQPVSLSYGGDNTGICAIIVMGGHVTFEDTYEALCGSLVALVVIHSSLTGEDGGLGADSLSNALSSHQVQRTEEDLPRWQGRHGLEGSFPFPADGSFCLGLALVQDIDIPNRTIRFTARPELHVPSVQREGHRFALVIPNATTDGRFRTDWVEREVHVRKGGSQSN